MSTSAGGAGGDDPALGQQHHPVGVLAGDRQVVHGGQHGQPALAAQPVDQLQHLLLVADVQGAWSARRAAAAARPGRAPGPGTPAAARRRRACPARRPAKPAQVERGRAPRRRRPGRAADSRPSGGDVRGAARAARSRAPRMPGGTTGLLRARWRPAGPGRRRGSAPVGVPSMVIVPRCGSSAADGPQQGGLAGAVRADDGDPLAGGDVEVDAVAGSRRRRASTRHARRRPSTHMRHPPACVRSTSDEERRAEERGDHADRHLGRARQRCARPGRPAPGTPRRTAATAAGSTGSSSPASSRTVCGTMMPTKPISPETETAAAVPSDAAAISRISRDALRVQAQARPPPRRRR